MIENPKRFIKEYVSYLLNDYKKYPGISTQRKKEEIEKINRQYLKGFITVDETMRLIVDVAYN